MRHKQDEIQKCVKEKGKYHHDYLKLTLTSENIDLVTALSSLHVCECDRFSNTIAIKTAK